MSYKGRLKVLERKHRKAYIYEPAIKEIERLVYESVPKGKVVTKLEKAATIQEIAAELERIVYSDKYR